VVRRSPHLGASRFRQVFILIPPIILITMTPISMAGRGVREATMVVAFGYAGLAQADGTVVLILFGAVSFMVGCVGGLVWITRSEKATAPANIKIEDTCICHALALRRHLENCFV
jgi:hypothetical protein